MIEYKRNPSLKDDFESHKIKPTSDGVPITTTKHSPNTVLGASLVLESILPELTNEQINSVAPLLAQEFEDYGTTRRLMVLELVKNSAPKEQPRIHDVNWAEGYNACRKTFLTRIENMKRKITGNNRVSL